MRVRKLTIHGASIFRRFNLDGIELDRLGDVVLLVGPNGAGKSRILQALEELVPVYLNCPTASSLQTELATKTASMTDAERATNPEVQRIQQQLRLRVEVDIEDCAPDKLVRLVPKQLGLSDHRSSSESQNDSNANTAATLGVGHLHNSTLPYIRRIQQRWWNVTHPGYSGDQGELVEIKHSYDRLNNLVLGLLGVPLNIDRDGQPTLFGQPIPDANLSDGQKVLLQYAVVIHAQGATLGNMVLLLDEIENHLHPSAVMDTIARLRALNPQGQIWIASHSVPLVSSLAGDDLRMLWYVEGGRAVNAGRQPERVLAGLLGDEEQIERLRAFSALPTQFAICSFAAECMTAPESVAFRGNDKQLEIVISNLFTRAVSSAPLRILDFGPGKGRLLAALKQVPSWMDRIDYFAYGLESFEEAEIAPLMVDTFTDHETRYISGEIQLEAFASSGPFDLAIMCNVLHEIPVTDWARLFGAEGVVTSALKEQGILLIFEVAELGEGERAHQAGFTVLEETAAAALFGTIDYATAAKDARLSCTTVKRDAVANVSPAKIVACMASLASASLAQIDALRSGPKSFRHGRKVAFWMVQFANAYTALAQMKEFGHGSEVAAVDKPVAG